MKQKFTHVVVIIFFGLESKKVLVFGIMKANGIAKWEIGATWTVVRILAVLLHAGVSSTVQDGNRHVVFQDLRTGVCLKPVISHSASWLQLTSLTGCLVDLESILPTVVIYTKKRKIFFTTKLYL